MDESHGLGTKVRALRRRGKLSQVELAQRLAISPSYLNLIEHNRRPLTAALLIKLAQVFELDLRTFAADHDERLASDLLEVFADPLFDGHELTGPDVREVAQSQPAVARAVLSLYQALQQSRESLDSLAARVSLELEGGEFAAVPASRLPSEEVTELISRHGNHFPELEEAAERIRGDARITEDDVFGPLGRWLTRAHGIDVQVETVEVMRGALRRYEPERRRVLLSELLAPRSRAFQLALQVGLLVEREVLERIAGAHVLTTDESRALSRVAMANYFGGALMMPYTPFLNAARALRYDVELLGHRFRSSFEQVAHRLTTLQRPGERGIPFHFLRVDIGGNISKRFSASGIRFARFSGACPRWNVHAAFLTPGRIRVQVSEMPEGERYFCIARSVEKGSAGYHAIHTVHAVGLGCSLEHAAELVYADGIDLSNRQAIVPVGVTCRLCPRMDCAQRAVPPLAHPLEVDENVRGASFYAPLTARPALGLAGK